uniref:Transmembrane protein 127 n=1 Tax=Schistocephalus solidus TaxID=70667 RepID=A0A0V0J567_SCHSO
MIPTAIGPLDGTGTVPNTPLFLKRRSNLAFFSNLLATLLLCAAVILKDSFLLSNAPCQLKAVGFQDIFSFRRVSRDAGIERLAKTLDKCLTGDTVILMYICLVFIFLALICTLIQLVSSLQLGCRFAKKIQSKGSLDICSVVLCSCCLGLMYWAASLISQHQFKQISAEFQIPVFSSSNETLQFIQNAKTQIDSFTLVFSGGFYFILLAGLFSIFALATRTFWTPIELFRRAYNRRGEIRRQP